MPARPPHPYSQEDQASPRGQQASSGWRWLKWLLGASVAGVLALLLTAGIALALAFPKLPDVAALADYRPKLPLRGLSADGETMAEFGEERRNLTPIEDIPPVMINAVLAIEDARFYEHSGVDYIGMLRAALANLGQSKSQGASTITMQVARNVYLSSEKSYLRKIYEVLLTFKLEALLSKDQILEIYMNQIFLGHRAYGFAAASQVYFGKPLKDLTVAEAAMLAGLPKAPSAYNPITNPKRARIRQQYIIERMRENGFISAEQARLAKEEPLVLRRDNGKLPLHAEYLAEMVRQAVFEQYGPETYTRGLTVHTTLDAAAQRAAYQALRRGVLDFERRQHYRGPEKFITLPTDAKARADAIDEVIASHPDSGELRTAVVLEAGPRKVVVVRGDDEPIEITGEGLKPVQSGLAAKAPPNLKLRPGAVVRVVKGASNWELTQLPEVEAAFVALDPRNGEIRALVGGFDFEKNKFNHVTQAWRQPGSSFKPFIYSAALEQGVTPATMVNDAPLYFSAGVTGGQPWEPKNYDGKFEGPMSVRTALAKSKNMVSIRILQIVGANEAQQWVTRFGFDADKHPPYLTMALGAGSVTPLQMAAGYGVFANGGHYAAPRFISRIDDHKGRVLQEFKPQVPEEMPQVIEPRNAFIMNQLLNEVARSGTAARAQATLKRRDLYGKTGTTNDADLAAPLASQPALGGRVGAASDTPPTLGIRETGGGLSLPIWINFMSEALRDTPVMELPVPAGVVNVAGEWYYDNYAPGSGMARIGGGEGEAAPAESDEKRSILDLFRN